MKICNPDLLDKRIVKCKTNFDLLFYVTDTRTSINHKGRKIFAIHTINQLFLLTVCAVEQLEYLLHRCLIVSFSVKLSVFIEVFSHFYPCDASAICLCDFLLPTQPDISLNDWWNDQIFIIRYFQCLWRKIRKYWYDFPMITDHLLKLLYFSIVILVIESCVFSKNLPSFFNVSQALVKVPGLYKIRTQMNSDILFHQCKSLHINILNKEQTSQSMSINFILTKFHRDPHCIVTVSSVIDVLIK